MTNETASAIIEVTIPMHYLDSESGSPEECGICYTQCCTKECTLYEQHTTCCDQPVCSGCLAKMCIRCRCTETCEQIICICPFCRDMNVVASVALFNSRKKVCKECEKKASEEEEDDQNEDDAGE